MPQFSTRSKLRLSTCHPELQRLMNAAIQEADFLIICGHRDEQEQNQAFKEGTSKLCYPNSRHNSDPSGAVDIAPFPLDWKDIQRFKDLAVIIKKVANDLHIPVEWGGDWKSFKDYPHWQLKQ